MISDYLMSDLFISRCTIHVPHSVLSCFTLFAMTSPDLLLPHFASCFTLFAVAMTCFAALAVTFTLFVVIFASLCSQ